MLGHRLQSLANIITTKNRQALNHEYNREYIFSEDFLNMKVINLGTSNAILHIVHKDWCTEMSTVSHTQHPSFP